MPYSKMKGSADIFVFPNLDAGNIGYKIAERLGQYHAVGPMILGLNQIVSEIYHAGGQQWKIFIWQRF